MLGVACLTVAVGRVGAVERDDVGGSSLTGFDGHLDHVWKMPAVDRIKEEE